MRQRFQNLNSSCPILKSSWTLIWDETENVYRLVNVNFPPFGFLSSEGKWIIGKLFKWVFDFDDEEEEGEAKKEKINYRLCNDLHTSS